MLPAAIPGNGETVKTGKPGNTGNTEQVKATVATPEKSVIPNPKEEEETAKEPIAGKKKPLYRRPWLWALLVVATGLGSGVAYGHKVWQEVEAQLPESVEGILTYKRAKTMTVKAGDGSILQEIGPLAHEKLEMGKIPNLVVQSFIASEDRRFLDHKGVDYPGIARATFANLRSGRVVEGGSTITQQLSRIVYLDNDKEFWRKIKEIRIAQKVEGTYDKERILERYLNLVYLGSGAYGVADAAWVYFGKSVDKLDVGEVATLAGIAPAPSIYSPLKDADAAKERRNIVLERMRDEGYISPGQAALAIAASLKLNPQQPKRLDRKVPYFTDYVQEQIPKLIPPDKIAEGGLTIETTINLKWQQAAEDAVAKAVVRYGESQQFSQASLTAIDPRTGEIKAMVGGDDYFNKDKNGQFNRVTQAKRQPGSTFKTLVYSTAIAAGFSPYKSLRDAPLVVDGYEPKNYNKGYRGEVSMRDALTYSVNIPAVKTLIDVGWNPIVKLAKDMGIESELKPTYSLALGASEVTLLELTSAYGTLANKGLHPESHGIARILDREGKVIYEAKEKPKQAIDEDSAAIMTWMLRSVVDSGTGTAAQLNRPVAGKTGTSDDYRDLWFVGYIPQLVAGVWLGNDDNTSTKGASSTAAAVWQDFMSRVTEEIPEEEFPDRPDLDGRKGIIAAEPLKPKQNYYKSIPPDQNLAVQSQPRRSRSSSRSSSSSGGSSSGSGSSRTQTRQTRQTTRRATPTPTRTASPAPQRSSAPARNVSKPASPSKPVVRRATTPSRPAPAPAPRPQRATAPAPRSNPAPAAPAPAPAPVRPTTPQVSKPAPSAAPPSVNKPPKE
nr:penicillin-binding protein 1A [Spirulina major]